MLSDLAAEVFASAEPVGPEVRLEKGKAEREPLLDDAGIAAELAERRGSFH